MLTIQTARPPSRCAYCHEGMDRVHAMCFRCGTACHPECASEARGCPTLGCVAAPRPRRKLLSRVGAALAWWLNVFVLLAVLAIVVAIAYPNTTTCGKNGNETAAIGALRTIGTAQALFRESDKDGNGEHDYAPSLKALGTAGTTGLLDPRLARGEHAGYRFELRRSSTLPGFCWIACAWPADDRSDRVFLTNHEGVTYYRPAAEVGQGLVLIDGTTCQIPAGWTRLGR